MREKTEFFIHLIRELVWTSFPRTGVVPNQYDAPRLLQRQCLSFVLQQDRTGSPDLPDQLVMIILNIDVLIRRLVVRIERVKIGCRV